jgi:hypothetical protein
VGVASIVRRATITGIENVTGTGTGIVVTRNDIRRRVMSTSDWYFLSVAVAHLDGQGSSAGSLEVTTKAVLRCMGAQGPRLWEADLYCTVIVSMSGG